MALGSSWWDASGLASQWVDDFSSATFTHYKYDDYDTLMWDECTMFQGMFSTGVGDKAHNDGNNYGYFYLEDSSGNVVAYALSCSLGGIPGDTDNVPQWVQLEPLCIEGVLDLVGPTKYRSAYFKGLFQLPVAGTRSVQAFRLWHGQPGATGTFTMFHYAPWAWFGTPPEVAAAVIMQAGLSKITLDAVAYWFIDTASFDAAHDEYNYSTGAAPWTDLDSTWTIYASREYGKTVASTVLEIIKHGRDYIYCDERGRIAVSSFTAPNETLVGLDHDDGIVAVEWEDTADYIFNHIIATWGTASRAEGSTALPPFSDAVDMPYSANVEPLLGSYDGDQWTHEEINATSRTKYGERFLPGRKFTKNVGGISMEVIQTHYPYLLSPHDATFPTAGGMVHVTNWLTSDSKPRKAIKVVQNMRGLDFAIGDQVTNVALTSDGATVPDTRCIEKTYDFKSMQVTSVLMEIPPNT